MSWLWWYSIRKMLKKKEGMDSKGIATSQWIMRQQAFNSFLVLPINHTQNKCFNFLWVPYTNFHLLSHDIKLIYIMIQVWEWFTLALLKNETKSSSVRWPMHHWTHMTSYLPVSGVKSYKQSERIIPVRQKD